MSEAGKAAGAGLVMSAGLASAVVGGATAAGEVGGLAMVATRKRIHAGDQGWDADGNFVCSRFIFNFSTMQVFDGSETYEVADILEVSYNDFIVVLKIRDQILPKKIAVGSPARADVIKSIIIDMWNDVTYTPDGKSRLKSQVRRLRTPGIGTFLRYGIRSILVGTVLWFVLKVYFDNNGAFRISEWYMAAAAVFALSMAWRLFRPIKTPNWRR